jgi:integrase/recombinase XerD
LDNNPFASLKKIKQQTKQIDVLTIEQVKLIFKAFDLTWYSDFRDYVLCNVMLDTFGRIDEICKLKKTDVDYINGVATFNVTKNGRFRHVPITRKVIRMIEDLNVETSDFDSEYIFISNHGTPLRPDAFRKHLKEVVERTDVKVRVYPHLFRHTSSTLFLANGGSVRALQKILGHAQIETTMIYSHMLDETIKEQHERFNPLQMINESPTIKTRRSNQ